MERIIILQTTELERTSTSKIKHHVLDMFIYTSIASCISPLSRLPFEACACGCVRVWCVRALVELYMCGQVVPVNVAERTTGHCGLYADTVFAFAFAFAVDGRRKGGVIKGIGVVKRHGNAFRGRTQTDYF